MKINNVKLNNDNFNNISNNKGVEMMDLSSFIEKIDEILNAFRVFSLKKQFDTWSLDNKLTISKSTDN